MRRGKTVHGEIFGFSALHRRSSSKGKKSWFPGKLPLIRNVCAATGQEQVLSELRSTKLHSGTALSYHHDQRKFHALGKKSDPEMMVSKVLGHVMCCEFPKDFKQWQYPPPVQLFHADLEWTVHPVSELSLNF